MVGLVAFVIGNSQVRKGYDLSILRGNGMIVGCNALYRDFDPDVLVAVDKPMYQEIKENYKGKATLVTLKDIQHDAVAIVNDGAQIELKNRYWWDSGKLAFYMAYHLNPDVERIFLLGFDFWANPNRTTVDNCYSNTLNYKPSNRPPEHDPAWAMKWNEIRDRMEGVKVYVVGPTRSYLEPFKAKQIQYNDFKSYYLGGKRV